MNNSSKIFDDLKFQMKRFEELLFLPVGEFQDQRLKSEWHSIRESLSSLEEEYNSQKNNHKILLQEVSKLKFARGLDHALLSLHQNNYSAAVIDYLIHPDPIEIDCTYNGIGQTFKVGVSDILVIKSRGRIKSIYLKKKIRALEGGDERSLIMVNKNGLDFEELLHKIQGNGNHILRIALSYAVNIFEYELSSSNTFKLISSPPEKFDPKLKEIKIDKLFDVRLYHKRLMEIDRLSHHLKDFEINLKKIDEINRYKNNEGIT